MSTDSGDNRATACIAIVVAGGQGSRFGSDVPKQLVSLAGHPILHHTLRQFEQTASVRSVIVVANPRWRPEIADIASYALRRTPHSIVDGGPTRNESIANAVATLADIPGGTLVLVHDGVRPFVSEDIILRVLKALSNFRAVIPTIPSADPLVRIEGAIVRSFEQRAEVVRGQSPQGFILSDLRDAFSSGQPIDRFDTLFELLLTTNKDFTIGHVEGELNNIKITTPIDRAIAGQIIMDGV